MNQLQELQNRWNGILRQKASQYEHTDRKNGKDVTGPSLDDIANEMNAFFTGLQK